MREDISAEMCFMGRAVRHTLLGHRKLNRAGATNSTNNRIYRIQSKMK
jgi:hypothetical protein